jgi:hypothetical protein
LEEFVGCGPHPDIKIETSSVAHAIILLTVIGFIVKLSKVKLGLWNFVSENLILRLESRNHKMHGAAALSQGGSLALRRLRAR